MTEINITQAEADALLAMEKHRVDETVWDYASHSNRMEIPLNAPESSESFVLDLWRGGIALSKVKYQNRTRKTIVLARLDIGGAPHDNPDGQTIHCPHIHLYREGFADQWAYTLDGFPFGDHSDIWAMLDDFIKYCNITKPPRIARTVI